MDKLNQELNSLFAAYHTAISEPAASPDFMPRLWGKIEAKRSFIYRLKKMSQLGVATAFAVCALSVILISPLANRDTLPAGTYVDMLAEAHADDTVAAMGGVHLDLLDDASQL
jgi:hypothetical protein